MRQIIPAGQPTRRNQPRLRACAIVCMLMHPRQPDMQWRNQGRLSDFDATSGQNNDGLFADSFHKFEIEALAEDCTQLGTKTSGQVAETDIDEVSSNTVPLRKLSRQ